MKGILKRKKNMKRITSLLLIFTIICSMSIPTLAAVADPAFSSNVDVKIDTEAKVNGQNTLAVTWQLKANKPNLTLTNTQGIRLAYDNTVLQLISWAGSANYDSEIGTLFLPASNACNIGAFNTQTMKVYAAKNTTGSTGFLSLTLGDEDSFFTCTQGVSNPVLSIRFAFRAGKSEADLKQDTIRNMTVSELAATNQSCGLLINAYANGNPGTFTSYEYFRQQGGVPAGGDTLNEPAIVIPPPPSNAPFSVKVISKVDSTIKFNGQNTIVTAFQVKSNEPGLSLARLQSFVVGYDRDVLQLMKWDGLNIIDDLSIGALFTGEIDDVMNSPSWTNARNEEFRAARSGSDGFLQLLIGDNSRTYLCPSEYTTLLQIRFAFKPSNGLANLDENSIRFLTPAELEWLAQGNSVELADNTDAVYTYGSQSGRVATPGNDKLAKPEIELPPPGVSLTGQIRAQNPQNITTIRLLQGGAEKYRTEIAADSGTGQFTKSFTIDGVAPGTYTLEIKKAVHTNFTVNNIIVGDSDVDLAIHPNSEIRTMIMRSGDVNNDGNINPSDVNIIWSMANFNRNVNEAINQSADLNGDGNINPSDVNIVWSQSNFNRGAVILDASSANFVSSATMRTGISSMTAMVKSVMAAMAADAPLSARINVEEDRGMLVLSVQVKANEPGIYLARLQSFVVGYNRDVLQLMKWDGLSIIDDASIGTLFSSEIDDAMNSPSWTNARNEEFRAARSGSNGYLQLLIGDNSRTYMCPTEYTTLLQIRFAFKPSYGLANLDENSIRFLTPAELERLAQGNSVELADNTDAVYAYGSQSGGIATPGNDKLAKPEIKIPIVEEPFVAVTDITGVQMTATAGVDLALTGTVVPDNATKKDIEWSLDDPGTTGARIIDNILSTAAAGTVTVLATVRDGSAVGTDYTKQFTIKINAPELVSIAVTTPPAKITYFEGETLNLTGMVVTAYYNDGSSKAVTGYTTVPANGAVLNTAGQQVITVSYTEGDVTKAANTSVTVNPLLLESIDITTRPNKTTYFVGEALNLTGMVVTAYYNNGSSKAVTGYTTVPVNGATLNTAGQQTITVSYTEAAVTKTANTSVTVNVAALENIAVTTPPTKETYFVGDALNLTGMVVTAYYNDGSSRAVTGYTTAPVNGATLNTTGQQTVTVSYMESDVTKTTGTSVTVSPVLLESIDITARPNKTTYFVGEALNLTGMVVTAYYNNGSSKAVTGYTTVPVNGATLNTAGQQTVIVSYTEAAVTKTANTSVTVNAAALENIVITTPPTKATYFVGDALNLTGMAVTAYYNDGSSKAITGYTTVPVNGASLNTAGQQTITVSYTEGGVTKATSTNVTVNAVVLESIAVTTLPTKVIYFVGETLNLNGMAVTAYYNDGSSRAVTGYTTVPASGATLNTTGQQSITASYTEGGVTKTASTSVTVNAAVLESIAITTPPTKATYFVGGTLILAGMVVTAYYNNGSSKAVTGYTTVPASGATLNSVGQQTITISYTEGDVTKTTSTSVTVNPILLESIEITNQPTKTTYFVGEALNLTGMVITAYYNNGSSKAVTGYTTVPINGATLNTAGQQTIAISYTEAAITKAANTSIIVNAAVLENIAVTTPPTKVTYFVGDALNLTGMAVTAYYNDGSSRAVTGYTTVPASGATLNTAGQQTITVSYTEGGVTKTASTNVTVNAVVIESISVTTTPTKTTYFVGETLNLAGMVVTAYYNNGSSKAITDYTTVPVNGATLNTAGQQTITVSYTEAAVTKTANTSVTVNAAALENIAVTTPPTKATYFVGDTLNLTGMAVTAYYNDGSSKAITSYTTVPVNGAALNTAGQQTITVSYTESGVTKTASTNVTVNAVVLESIAVTTSPTKTTYFVGETLNLAGLIVTASYNDGSSRAVTSYTTVPASGATLNTAGQQMVTVSYTEGGVTKTASTNVTVNPILLESIEITTPPTKTTYVIGETLNLAGMVVTAYYNNGTSKAVTGYTTIPANGAALNTVGQQTVTVSYTEANVTKTVGLTVAVYARIEYKANGGTGVDVVYNVAVGDAYTVNTNTFGAPAGMVFNRWNTAADGTGITYTVGSKITVVGNLTLYAQWIPTSHETPPITSLRISASPTISVKRGETVKFDVIVNEGANSDGVIWSVSNTVYATVNPVDGTVTILNKVGTVVLIATDPVSGLSHVIVLRIT